MGLQFVFGGSGSGKSTLVFQKVIEQSQQDMAKHFFLMVPDQFTMYTQKEICEMHPRGGIMNIDVLSFSRLIHRIADEVGQKERVMLDDLIGYEIQKKKLVDNTEAFIKGLPANNVLLYGDRGTGKSSTIHAILNAYKEQGLRMIEIPKSAVEELSLIREYLADSPMKFIIYIDDLSFDSQDNAFTELKAALEGGLSACQPNTLIYATSNRRHLIKENFSDREDDVNKNDTRQEQLSLSDRFGLTITFINPDKKDYLDIVEKIAADRGLQVDAQRLDAAAEQWAVRRGGRSPRCARQFIDHVESALRRGKEW